MKNAITTLIILNVFHWIWCDFNIFRNNNPPLLDKVMMDNKVYQEYHYNKKSKLKTIKTVRPNVYREPLNETDSILYIEDLYTQPYSINYRYDKQQRIKSITFKNDLTNYIFRNEIFSYDTLDRMTNINETSDENHFSFRTNILLSNSVWGKINSEISLDYYKKKIYLYRENTDFKSTLFLDKDGSVFKEEKYDSLGLNRTIFYEYYPIRNINHLSVNPIKPFTKHIKSISRTDKSSKKPNYVYKYYLEFDNKNRVTSKRIVRVVKPSVNDTLEIEINKFTYLYK